MKSFSTKKNAKISKQANAFKGYASPYNVEILKAFNLKLKLKESAIKNKLIDLLTELKGLKFETTLVLLRV